MSQIYPKHCIYQKQVNHDINKDTPTKENYK